MLYKDYFIPDNSQYLFFKLFFFFQNPLPTSTGTIHRATQASLSICSLLKPPFLPHYPGHLSFSRRCQSAFFKYLISTDTPASLLRHLQFSSYDF